MSDKVYVGQLAKELDVSDQATEYTKVILWYDDEHAFVAGNDGGAVLEKKLPWATQQIADDLLASVKGRKFLPFTAKHMVVDPAVELGDAITVGGSYVMLGKYSLSFSAEMAMEASAPFPDDLDEEYPVPDSTARALKNVITLGKSYYGAKITRQNGIQISKANADGTTGSRATLNSDEVSFRNDDGTEALYFDINEGKFKFRGDVHITGGDLNINNNFIVDTEGNVSLNGDINLSGGKIVWGENNPAKDKLDEDDLPDYLHKTYIDETQIYSPSIYGGNLYATADSDFYARMTANAFELMREGSDTARAQLRAYTNLVELVLGVGSDEGGENGRLYLQKGVGSVNGSDDQNVAYLNYKDADGNDSFIGFSDRDGMFLTASKISLTGTVDFSNATVIGLGAASGDTLAGTDCTIEADDDVTITAGDDVIITAGPVAIRVDAGNERVNFWFGDSEVGYILDADGLNPA